MKHQQVNPVVTVGPVQLASLFATLNLDQSEQAVCSDVIRHIRDGRFDAANSLLSEFTRPEFLDVATYSRRIQFSALVRKVPFPGGNSERKRRALDSFFESERRCRTSNSKFRLTAKHREWLPDHVRVILSRARAEVARILGPLDLDSIINLSRPGSGVAIGTRDSSRVSLPFKIGDTDLACTASARYYATRLLQRSPLWLEQHSTMENFRCESGVVRARLSVPITIVAGNRITFVPKDARTLRTIAIEPSLNVCLQLGCHEYIAHRLRRYGNCISDQSRNQELARLGSILDPDCGFSTLDLASASDSISIELVRALLPSDWFAVLDDLRSKTGVVNGRSHTYEKFSSMGNGYTFALETVIFLAIARATQSYYKTEGAISVYGDDIICPTSMACVLIEMLNRFGFEVNLSKSFIVGPFRESCGADWYRGKNTTPVYLRRAKLRHTDLYQFLNRIDTGWVIDPIRDLCVREIKKTGRLLLSPSPQDDAGALRSNNARRHSRYNSSLQRNEFQEIRFYPDSPRTFQSWAYLAALCGGHGSNYSRKGRGCYRRVWSPPYG